MPFLSSPSVVGVVVGVVVAVVAAVDIKIPYISAHDPDFSRSVSPRFEDTLLALWTFGVPPFSATPIDCAFTAMVLVLLYPIMAVIQGPRSGSLPAVRQLIVLPIYGVSSAW